MAEIKIGKVRQVFRGNYDPLASDYAELDTVNYEGSSWTALRDVSAGVVPVEGLDWTMVAEKGDDGSSAYEIAVLNDFVGTEEEWLASFTRNWTDMVTRGAFVSVTEITDGQRLEYTFDGSTVYRFIPEPYIQSNDKFYSDIDLTTELASRI